jgi:hypothetical protein
MVHTIRDAVARQAASASGTASPHAAACHRYTVTFHIQIFSVKLAWIEPIFCR